MARIFLRGLPREATLKHYRGQKVSLIGYLKFQFLMDLETSEFLPANRLRCLLAILVSRWLIGGL